MLVNPKETTHTVIFTTFATKNVKKCPKNWKNSLYELPTELPLFLEKSFLVPTFHYYPRSVCCCSSTIRKRLSRHFGLALEKIMDFGNLLDLNLILFMNT